MEESLTLNKEIERVGFGKRLDAKANLEDYSGAIEDYTKAIELDER